MLLSKHNLIYLHPPKTAGNSIQTLLLPHSDDSMRVYGHQDGVDRFEVRGNHTQKKHATMADYRASLTDFERYLIAISVRHPFDRAVSMFFSPHRWHVQQGAEWRLTEPVWDEGEFLECANEMVSITDFLRVESAVIRPQFAIRYENLTSDLNSMASKMALPITADTLPHRNATAGIRDEFRRLRESRALTIQIQKLFQSDMDLFNYTDAWTLRA